MLEIKIYCIGNTILDTQQKRNVKSVSVFFFMILWLLNNGSDQHKVTGTGCQMVCCVWATQAYSDRLWEIIWLQSYVIFFQQMPLSSLEHSVNLSLFFRFVQENFKTASHTLQMSEISKRTVTICNRRFIWSATSQFAVTLGR